MQACPDGCLLAAGQTEPDALGPLYIEVAGSGEGPQNSSPQQSPGLRYEDLCRGGG